MKKGEIEWELICDEVAVNVEKTYLNIPIGKRKQLGIEPGKDGKFADVESYDRNRWVVCYINLLEWQKKAQQLLSMQHVFSSDD